jgi:hypothetical protein
MQQFPATPMQIEVAQLDFHAVSLTEIHAPRAREKNLADQWLLHEGSVGLVARPEGFEPPTNWFEASYSIQLSYGRPGGAG